jgi:ADP-ribose pyrophosphatase YjhB (NUDIX family)
MNPFTSQIEADDRPPIRFFGQPSGRPPPRRRGGRSCRGVARSVDGELGTTGTDRGASVVAELPAFAAGRYGCAWSIERLNAKLGDRQRVRGSARKGSWMSEDEERGRVGSTKWQTLSSRTAYENHWIRVREDAVLRPDGEPGVYGVVEVRSPAVFVVPVTDAGDFVLVEVDRYAIGRRSWEVPAGGSDGDALAEAARRELREETGLAASRWRDLGQVFSLNGVADAPGRVFLAQGLSEVGGSEAEVEGITGLRTASGAQLAAMIGRDEITDNESLGALLKALVALGAVG